MVLRRHVPIYLLLAACLATACAATFSTFTCLGRAARFSFGTRFGRFGTCLRHILATLIELVSGRFGLLGNGRFRPPQR